MSKQSWLGTFWEANANVVIGFSINWTLNLVTLPILWDPAHPKSSAFYIGLVFTAASYARQFVIRRLFNRTKRFDVPAR